MKIKGMNHHFPEKEVYVSLSELTYTFSPQILSSLVSN